jgi:hypothetical protein
MLNRLNAAIHLPLPEYGPSSARVRCGRRRIRRDRRGVCGRYLPCMRINSSRQSDDRQNSRRKWRIKQHRRCRAPSGRPDGLAFPCPPAPVPDLGRRVLNDAIALEIIAGDSALPAGHDAVALRLTAVRRWTEGAGGFFLRSIRSSFWRSSPSRNLPIMFGGICSVLSGSSG